MTLRFFRPPLLPALLWLLPKLAAAQAVATLMPAQPASLRDSLTITFDATRGDGGLATWAGDVYAYTAVITPASTSLTDWQHVQGPWAPALSRLKMRALGGHRYALRIRPDTFYGLAAGEQVNSFAFVFRSLDGSVSGRAAGGADVLLPLYATTPRSYASHQWSGGVLTVTASDGATLTVQPYAPAVLRVAFYPGGTASVPAPSLAVSAAAMAPAGTLTDTPTRLTLAAPGLTLLLDKNPLRLRYLRGPDTLLAETPGYFETGSLRGVRFGLRAGEALYGTGTRALPVNRRGQRVQLYNQAHYGYSNGEANLNISIPLVLSGRGYGLFFDDVRPGYLDLGQTDGAALEFGTENDHLTYFVLAQTDLPALLAAYTALTGRQPLPPRWALGYIQSKYGYQTEAEARSIVQTMRAQNFPLSGLVLDLYWFGGMGRMGDLSWDRSRFPNPVRMLHDFDSVGVKTVLITEPYITQQSSNYAAAAGGLLARTNTGAPYVIGNFWAGSAGLLDMTNPATRAWLWPFYRARAQEGVAGWWSDLGEPETHPDAMRHVGGSAREVHNGFASQWAGLLQEKYQQEFPGQRLFNLTRSGFAGMQRLGATPWSGDVQRSWSGLQAQVPIMLGMGLSGVAYEHADAGGFTGGGQNNELYVRWLQFAAFTPIMRAHSEGVPPEPVYYPEPYRSIVRDYAHLRHRLLPTTYSLAWENSQTGAPLARPVDFAEPTATPYPNANDAYLWGENLLVAPVLSPGQTQRSIALPADGPWLDYWTNQQYAGGTTATVPAPLTRLPLLVRAGSFVATQPYRASTAQGQLDTLQLAYYPAQGVVGRPAVVYDDDGRTPDAFGQGQYQLLHFQDYPTGAADMTIIATATGPGYASAPRRRVVEYAIQRLRAASSMVTFQGLALPVAASVAAYAALDSAVYFDAAAQVLRVRFGWRHQMATVRLFGAVLATNKATPILAAISLNAPYPNPFTDETTISYEVAQPGTYQLRVHALTGQLVASVAVVAATAGSGAVQWAGTDSAGRPLPPGVYVLELNGQHRRVVRQ